MPERLPGVYARPFPGSTSCKTQLSNSSEMLRGSSLFSGLLPTGNPGARLKTQVVKVLALTPACPSFAATGHLCPLTRYIRYCTGQAKQDHLQARMPAPGLVKGSWRAQVVTVLQRGGCLCPVSGPGSLGLGCWSSGGSWESQEHYFLCSKGNSREKRRLKVQSQQGQQAEQGTSAEDCWQIFLWAWRERQEESKQQSC